MMACPVGTSADVPLRLCTAPVSVSGATGSPRGTRAVTRRRIDENSSNPVAAEHSFLPRRMPRGAFFQRLFMPWIFPNHAIESFHDIDGPSACVEVRRR